MTKYELLLKAFSLQSDLKNSLEDVTILISSLGENRNIASEELEKQINNFNLIKSTINNKTI